MKHHQRSCHELGVCNSRESGCTHCDQADLGSDFPGSPWDLVDRLLFSVVLLVSIASVVGVIAMAMRTLRG